MIELHRQRVLEHVAPRRRDEEQARAVGHQAAVDQRPGVVDEAGAQAGDQRAEIDLNDHETEQHQRARADAAGAATGARGSSSCAVHSMAAKMTQASVR